MKLTIRVESFEETTARVRTRAKRRDRGEPAKAERCLTFENTSDMLECLTKEGTRLCEAARGGARTVASLAQLLGPNKRAVVRDVKRLAELRFLKVSKVTNPGHGQVVMVQSATSKFELRAKF